MPRGFTLIEAMLVIAVVAILLTAGLPSFSALIDRHRLRGAAAELHAALLLARAEALRRGTAVSVAFGGETDGGWCHALSDQGPCDCLAPAACTLGGEPVRASHGDGFRGVQLSAGFATPSSATFHPARGTASPGTVRLGLDGNDEEIRIVVSSLGRIRLCATGAAADYPPC
jgi:prepilin-type N-terminal cleavage/methylation domain-containing protein